MHYGLHKHNFWGKTTINNGHMHGYSGVTSANPDVPKHTHYMMGQTTFDDGHVHQYRLQTGPSIPTTGGHAHYYQAATAVENGHSHYMDGYTDYSQ